MIETTSSQKKREMIDIFAEDDDKGDAKTKSIPSSKNSDATKSPTASFSASQGTGSFSAPPGTASVRFCPQCGTQRIGAFAFCANCGLKF